MKWEARCITHRRKSWIAVFFERNPEWNERIKSIDGSRWSSTVKAWLIPDTPGNRDRFRLARAPVLSIDHERRITQFRHWLRSKRYSDSTVGVYTQALQVFFLWHNNRDPAEMDEEDVIRFNNEYILKKKLSSSWQNQFVNALKLYFSTVEKRKLDPELIHRPRKEKVLPNVLSKEEVKAILSASNNLKHRVMLSMIYSCGLRRGELLKLKPTDIDAHRGVVTVRQAKGKKDRIVTLSPKVLEMLREYYKSNRPKVWLFEGNVAGEQYGEASLMKVFKRSLEKAGVKKLASLHWLRHSYATHLLESGTDLRFIQELLGHKSSRTTEIYTHVSTRQIQHIRSPFDDL